MTEQEKKLILDLATHSINVDDFLSSYPADINNKTAYTLHELKRAYLKKNAQDVEYALLFGFIFNAFSSECVNLLSLLLVETWHYKHEDIALILQDLKSSESVNALYHAAVMKLDYVDYDESYALGRTCVHALGEIDTKESREKLKLLTQSGIPIIEEKAEKQLRKNV